MSTMPSRVASRRLGLAALATLGLCAPLAAANDTAPTRYVGPFGPDGQAIASPAGEPNTRWVEPRPLMPVDRTVGDLDPLGVSHRWIDPAQAAFSPGARLYREGYGAGGFGDPGSAPAPNPHTGLMMSGQFRYEAPGVQAWMDRPDYLVRTGPGGQFSYNVAPLREGSALALIPPNTVFNLIPPDRLDTGQSEPESPGPDHRIDRRLDHLIDARIDGRQSNDLDLEQIERARRQGQPVRRW